MEILSQDKALNIIGIEVRTNNDTGDAVQTIPLHWQRFFKESIIDQIPNKVSADVYAIYTRFENEGLNNNGDYSFIIGAQVNNLEHIPEPFISIVIPKSNYQVFEAATGQPELIVDTWQKVWTHQFKHKRTFVADYELYRQTGEIDILIGVI